MNLNDLVHAVLFSSGELRVMPLAACLAHLDASEPHLRERMQLVTMTVGTRDRIVEQWLNDRMMQLKGWLADEQRFSETDLIQQRIIALTAEWVTVVSGRGPDTCAETLRPEPPQQELPTPDCGDNSCRYAKRPIRGMRTNGGCRCDDCEACGSSIRPGSPQTHKTWCPTQDLVPEHHRPRTQMVTLPDEREVP